VAALTFRFITALIKQLILLQGWENAGADLKLNIAGHKQI